MTLKDLLKKKEKIGEDITSTHASLPNPPSPEFTFVRTTTNTQELITPPSFPGDTVLPLKDRPQQTSKRHSLSRLRSSSNTPTVSNEAGPNEKRLSARLHLRSRTSSSSSVNVPSDLPTISDGVEEDGNKEAEWEKRATILANVNANARSTSGTLQDGKPAVVALDKGLQSRGDFADLPATTRNISDAVGDGSIQEAIRLHESGDLAQSTAMFGSLAESNAMAQILYGLALRHGWGIPQDASLAITYLSQAASDSAAVESQALSAGMKKGGAAKGELVLAMYELANSFRHGWGVEKDPVAARSYYETAANLGDTDAMNEVARCYEEGFGGKKNKFAAAKYYRLAEQNGNKILGNSWIWKDKYAPKDLN